MAKQGDLFVWRNGLAPVSALSSLAEVAARAAGHRGPLAWRDDTSPTALLFSGHDGAVGSLTMRPRKGCIVVVARACGRKTTITLTLFKNRVECSTRSKKTFGHGEASLRNGLEAAALGALALALLSARKRNA